MKTHVSMLSAFFLLSCIYAMGADLTTNSGKVYKNFEVANVINGKAEIYHDSGLAVVPLADLPDELRKQYAKEESEYLAKIRRLQQHELEKEALKKIEKVFESRLKIVDKQVEGIFLQERIETRVIIGRMEESVSYSSGNMGISSNSLQARALQSRVQRMASTPYYDRNIYDIKISYGPKFYLQDCQWLLKTAKADMLTFTKERKLKCWQIGTYTLKTLR